jgi:hypothetical protein
MNEYMKAFQNIAQSAAVVAADDYKSLEIKESATNLSKSIQPCFDELRESATRLKGFVQKCRNDIYHAEDVWTCKIGIIQASKQEIWQQIGELSGCHFRMRELGSQCKNSALEKSQDHWDKNFEIRVRQKWFIDATQKQKKGIGWKEKDDFIKDVPVIVNLLCMEVEKIIKHSLILVYQDISTINLELITQCISILDGQTKAAWNNQIILTVGEIKNKFENPTIYLPQNIKSLNTALNPTLDNLYKQRLGDLYWEEVERFKKEVSTNINNFINSIFYDRLNLANKALIQAIEFYNEFLEKQERYQQETPAQRQAEKDWIDSQWAEIQKVEKAIKVMNPLA